MTKGIAKRIIAIAAGVLAVLCAVFSFTACASNEPSEEPSKEPHIREEVNKGNCILHDLYKSGELTRNDLMNMAALRVGCVKIVEYASQSVWDYKEIDFEPTAPEALSETTKQNIEQAFRASFPDDEVEEFKLNHYGRYGIYEIVSVKYRLKNSDFPLGIQSLIVSNVDFGLIGYDEAFLAWDTTENTLRWHK